MREAIMRTTCIILSILLCSSLAFAKEYGTYDPKKILSQSESPAGKRYGIDLEYLDMMLNNLALHAKKYPPDFDTPQDKQRAIADVETLSGMLDALTRAPNPDPEILRRAGLLNSMGRNLDIPGSEKKATLNFEQLLAIAPADPGGNYMYGTFLANSGKPSKALPYLKQALAAGMADASYSLGLAYLALNDEAKALENLEAYRQNNPNNASVASLIEAIGKGRLERRTSSPPPASPAAEQENTGPPPGSEAEKLLETINAKELLEQSIGTMVDLQIRKKPLLAPYRKTLLAFFAKYMRYETLRPELIKMYAETFTESELKEINAFYSSPTGKRLLIKNQEIMKEAGDIGLKRIQAHRSELEQMIQEEAERLKKSAENPPGTLAP
jgi:hypothetical protein